MDFSTLAWKKKKANDCKSPFVVFRQGRSSPTLLSAVYRTDLGQGGFLVAFYSELPPVALESKYLAVRYRLDFAHFPKRAASECRNHFEGIGVPAV